jgi:GTP:adenosylcobinamide-phosphate guanylyltransferase
MAGFTALILAGKRKHSGDGLNTADALKASMTMVGMPMIDRVIASLSASKHVARIVVCGPHELGAWPGVTFFPTADSPARSFLAFLESQADVVPLIVTTADHALLTTEMIDHFCEKTLAQGTNFTLGMADKAMVMAAYPGTTRTGFQFRDGAWSSCNLFGVLSPKVAALVHFWRFVEQNRKKPLKVVAAFGWLNLLGVVLRVWTVQGAIRRAGARFGITASPVIMPWAEAAIDVDTLGDKSLAESILEARALPAE